MSQLNLQKYTAIVNLFVVKVKEVAVTKIYNKNEHFLIIVMFMMFIKYMIRLLVFFPESLHIEKLKSQFKFIPATRHGQSI